MAEELSAETVMESQSQSQASSTKKRPWKNDKLCLDDYLHLLQSRQTLHLTMSQLNQVIRIHGFKKIHHAPKKVLVDAVESLDLVDLPRSTLSENVSAFAAVTLEDVVADLSELNWQECCVTSVEKLCFYNGQSLLSASSDQSLGVVNHSQPQTQKSKRTDEIDDLIPESFQRSLKATKMVPKRKRSGVRALDSVTSTVDSASLASC
ncbi:hypothetical protein VNO77_37068 [Canavalia gladiata]|uniref:DUF7787 domain-containing protein n=1 Tax=Canavalia gladiata TaxID=3824 RepID=A0AAN9KAG4_CANGL